MFLFTLERREHGKEREEKERGRIQRLGWAKNGPAWQAGKSQGNSLLFHSFFVELEKLP